MWTHLLAVTFASPCIVEDLRPPSEASRHELAASDVVFVGMVNPFPPKRLRQDQSDALAIVEPCGNGQVISVVVTEVLADRVASALSVGHRVSVVLPDGVSWPPDSQEVLWYLDLIPGIPARKDSVHATGVMHTPVTPTVQV